MDMWVLFCSQQVEEEIEGQLTNPGLPENGRKVMFVYVYPYFVMLRDFDANI